MDIFISWSGETSKAVANVIRHWFPCIIQSVNPFLSSENISKGQRWSDIIAKNLENCNVGIICVTPDNIKSPWLNFEAGALSKKINDAHICTFLYECSNTDLLGDSPLSQYQSTIYSNRDDVFSLLQAINSKSSPILNEDVLKTSFDTYWNRIEKDFEDIKVQKTVKDKPKRPSNDEILSEILNLLRANQNYSLVEIDKKFERIMSGLFLLSNNRLEQGNNYFHQINIADSGEMITKSYEMVDVRSNKGINTDKINTTLEYITCTLNNNGRIEGVIGNIIKISATENEHINLVEFMRKKFGINFKDRFD